MILINQHHQEKSYQIGLLKVMNIETLINGGVENENNDKIDQ